jgi:hypothetical protein
MSWYGGQAHITSLPHRHYVGQESGFSGADLQRLALHALPAPPESYDLLITARWDMIFRSSLAEALLSRFAALRPSAVVFLCLNGVPPRPPDTIEAHGRLVARVPDSMVIIPREHIPAIVPLWPPYHNTMGLLRYHPWHRLTSGGNPSMGTFSMDHRTKPPRIWRLLSDPLARTPYG